MTTEPCAGKQTVRASARASCARSSSVGHIAAGLGPPRDTACHRECSAIRLVPAPHLAVAPATPKFPLAAKSARRRKAYPPTRHPLVRRHPGSERKALYIAATASHIVGLPVADGQALLAELINFATQTQFVYRHRR